MFNIKYIWLHSGNRSKKVELFNNTYVYGQNSSGKTALWCAIDYILGSSKDDIYEYDGLQNIDAFSAMILNEDTKEALFLKRNREKAFYIKRDESSEFSLVSNDLYKDEISRLFGNIDYRYFDIYQNFFNERLSFRAFSFLNLIGEKGLGDLSIVFTESKELKHQIRIRDINTFIFNFENIETIYNARIRLENIEKQLSALSYKQNEYNFAFQKIHDIFTELNIKYGKDSVENKNNFLKFKESFLRNDGTPNKDLICLQKASLALSEEIKTYGFLKRQTQFLAKRNKRIDYILQTLAEIASKDSSYDKYVNQIKIIIDKNESDNSIIALTDYAKAIKQIEDEKLKIDEEICKIKKSTYINDYERVLKYIGVLENCFQILDDNINFNEILVLKSEKQKLQSIVKDIRNQISNNAVGFVNNFLTESYLNANLSSKFAKDDEKIKKLKIIYNPIFVGVSAQKENEKGETEWYVPGSMARQTTWQILTYLGLMKFIKQKMKGLPILPILLMDAIEQPFADGANVEEIYSLIKKCCQDIGLQLIICSKNDSEVFDDCNKINLNKEGLNPFMS